MITGKACLHGRAFCVFGVIPPVGNFAKIHARGRGGLLGTVRKDSIPPWGPARAQPAARGGPGRRGAAGRAQKRRGGAPSPRRAHTGRVAGAAAGRGETAAGRGAGQAAGGPGRRADGRGNGARQKAAAAFGECRVFAASKFRARPPPRFCFFALYRKPFFAPPLLSHQRWFRPKTLCFSSTCFFRPAE